MVEKVIRLAMIPFQAWQPEAEQEPLVVLDKDHVAAVRNFALAHDKHESAVNIEEVEFSSAGLKYWSEQDEDMLYQGALGRIARLILCWAVTQSTDTVLDFFDLGRCDGEDTWVCAWKTLHDQIGAMMRKLDPASHAAELENLMAKAFEILPDLARKARYQLGVSMVSAAKKLGVGFVAPDAVLLNWQVVETPCVESVVYANGALLAQEDVVKEGSACYAFISQKDYPTVFKHRDLQVELWRHATGGPIQGARSESICEAVACPKQVLPTVEHIGVKYARARTKDVFLLKIFWDTPGPQFSTVIEHYYDMSRPMSRVSKNSGSRRSSAIFNCIECPELFYGGSVTSLTMYHQTNEDSFGECQIIDLFPPRWTSCPTKKRRRRRSTESNNRRGCRRKIGK